MPEADREGERSPSIGRNRRRAFSSMQGLQIEADRRDGSFEFVGNGVDEAVVLLVATDLSQKEDGVKNQAGGDSAEEDYAEEDFYAFAPVEDDPAEAYGNSDSG